MSDFKVIKGGVLIDGTGNEPLENSVVVIEGNKIVSVGRVGDVEIPEGADVIDAAGKTVLPGLMDCHIHLLGIYKLGPHIAGTRKEVHLIRAVNQVRDLLMAGFTTVRDAGSNTARFLKIAIEEGTIPGPRIVASGTIATAAGHTDKTNVPYELLRKEKVMACGENEMRLATRLWIREGVDCIKIFTTGGMAGKHTSPSEWQMTPDEIRAVTDEAHRVGKKVLTHAQGMQGVKNALYNGVDSIEHGFELDDEMIQYMVDNGRFYVPTFAVVHLMADRAAEWGAPIWATTKAKHWKPIHRDSFIRAYRAGVKIAMGTDFTGWKTHEHGRNAWELELMVNAGMTPMDALVSATKMGAECMGLDNVGTVESGKLADIIVVDGDPLEDIRILQEIDRIKIVMKDGKIEVNRGL